MRLRPSRLRGAELSIDPSDDGHTCAFEEFLTPPVACDLALVPFVPAAVIDCGAHIGLYTVLTRRSYPSAAVTAFEPVPRNAHRLRENLARNGFTSVRVIEAAVSATAGPRRFFSSVHSEAGRLADGGTATPPPEARVIDVQVVDLVAFVREHASDSLLLKVDIEGEEERLMPALAPVLPRRCAIFFETHRGIDGWRVVERALAAHAFSVRLLHGRDIFCDGFALRDW